MNVAVKQAKATLGDAGLGRVTAIGALVILAFALQTTLLEQATVLGVVPQLVLVVVVTLAYLDGERVGVVVGFAGGLLQDLSLPPGSIVGLTALVYTMIGYGVGSLRNYTSGESIWTPVLAVTVSSLVAEASYALLAIMLGQPWVSLSFTAKVAGLVILYNTLLTPFTFPIVKKIADKFRPERVYRW